MRLVELGNWKSNEHNSLHFFSTLSIAFEFSNFLLSPNSTVFSNQKLANNRTLFFTPEDRQKSYRFFHQFQRNRKVGQKQARRFLGSRTHTHTPQSWQSANLQLTNLNPKNLQKKLQKFTNAWNSAPFATRLNAPDRMMRSGSERCQSLGLLPDPMRWLAVSRALRGPKWLH